MDSQTYRVTVAGRSYRLTSSQSAEHVKRAISCANRRLGEFMTMNPRASKETAAISSTLSLASELIQAQDDNQRLRRQLAELHQASETG